MSAYIDLTGQKFGRLLVIQRSDNSNQIGTQWLCRCDCNNEKIILGSSLKNGNTKSCGCLRTEKTKQRSTKHGHSGIPPKIYQTWKHMRERCANPNHVSYHNYGNRGIIVCDRWEKFENFLKDMGEPPTKQHQIDRINNDGNYCKSNCRWVSPKEQARNTRTNHLIFFNGKTQCLTAWAEEVNIHRTTLWKRMIKLNWSIEKTLTTPVAKRRL